jgi:hypothetical protein
MRSVVDRNVGMRCMTTINRDLNFYRLQKADSWPNITAATEWRTNMRTEFWYGNLKERVTFEARIAGSACYNV